MKKLSLTVLLTLFLQSAFLQTMNTSRVKQWIDQYLVDGLVNFIGALAQWLSAMIRMIQTGSLQHYILFLVTGTLALIFFQIK